MTDYCLRICYTQRKIYEYMAELGYDIKVFSDEYLSSDFCHRSMDGIYSRFQTEFANECADFYMPEIGDKLVMATEATEINVVIAGVVGYLYRYLQLMTCMKSAELAKIVPFDRMLDYAYDADHVGFDEIIERVMDEFSLERNEFSIDKISTYE